jgi:hypothetical protein
MPTGDRAPRSRLECVRLSGLKASNRSDTHFKRPSKLSIYPCYFWVQCFDQPELGPHSDTPLIEHFAGALRVLNGANHRRQPRSCAVGSNILPTFIFPRPLFTVSWVLSNNADRPKALYIDLSAQRVEEYAEDSGLLRLRKNNSIVSANLFR